MTVYGDYLPNSTWYSQSAWTHNCSSPARQKICLVYNKGRGVVKINHHILKTKAMDIESSLENNPNYRFIPLGPSSAAGVIAAVFIILLFCWLYLAVRCHGFLRGSVIRLVVFCLVGATGYILRIVCNSQFKRKLY